MLSFMCYSSAFYVMLGSAQARESCRNRISIKHAESANNKLTSGKAGEQSGLEDDRFIFCFSSAVHDGVLHTLNAVSVEGENHRRQGGVNLASV